MNKTHRSSSARRWASALLVAQAALLGAAAQANDWDRAQAAFAELDDRGAFEHLQRAAATGDTRAKLALALAARHGDRLFAGVVQADPEAAKRWRRLVDDGPAYSAANVPAGKATKAALYLSAGQAWALKQASANEVLLLDIRSRAEAAYVGMPSDADALVPFREHDDQMVDWDARRQTFSMSLNPHFVKEVAQVLQAKGLGKDARVVLICRSGDRSAKAADLLLEQGYTRVHSVVDGFEGDLDARGRRAVNGWKNAGLPWSYKLEKSKVMAAAN